MYVFISAGCQKVNVTYIESSHNLTINGIRECTSVCNKRGLVRIGLKVIFNYKQISFVTASTCIYKYVKHKSNNK